MNKLSTRILSTIAIGLSFGISAISARADQCMLVPKQQALAAMNRLEPEQTIYTLQKYFSYPLPITHYPLLITPPPPIP
jgi:hypothetical protein